MLWLEFSSVTVSFIVIVVGLNSPYACLAGMIVSWSPPNCTVVDEGTA